MPSGTSGEGVGRQVRGFAGLLSLVSLIPSEPSSNPAQSTKVPDSPKSVSRDERGAAEPRAEQIATPATVSKPAGKNNRKIILGLAAAVLVSIWILAVNDQGKSPSSLPYVPPRETNLPRPNPPPVSPPRIPAPTVFTEVAPPEGDGTRTLNLENIRWCLYQDRRIEIIKSRIAMENDADISNFNAVVTDYNGRCGAFRYLQSNMTTVRAELALREPSLQSQAEAILGSWPHRRRSLPSNVPPPPFPTAGLTTEMPATRLPPKFPPDLPQSSRPPQSSDVNTEMLPALPPPTVVDRVGTPNPAGSVPTEQSADVIPDLLQIEDAKTVQRRLSELGYFSGPAPNGVWTSRWRRALRDFKSLNGLPPDDMWDEQTRKRLFASGATKLIVGGASTKQQDTAQVPESAYAPPPGATYNPLNRGDAIELQKRLAELGFFNGKSDGIWGPASRTALREFKTMSGLPSDDQWDVASELALKAERPVRATYTFVGGWAEEVAECRSAAVSGAPLRISVDQAEMGGVVCKFGPAVREGTSWRVRAACTGSGKSWNSNVLLSVSDDRLTWSSAGDTNSFVRCRN